MTDVFPPPDMSLHGYYLLIQVCLMIWAAAKTYTYYTKQIYVRSVSTKGLQYHDFPDHDDANTCVASVSRPVVFSPNGNHVAASYCGRCAECLTGVGLDTKRRESRVENTSLPSIFDVFSDGHSKGLAPQDT